MKRCSWSEASQLEIDYHDAEWGVPSYDDTHLFEMLTLEGAQAGLSWSTILSKRQGYRNAFAHFDISSITKFTPKTVEKLLRNPAIVRHRGKVESTIANATATLNLQDQYGSLGQFLWQFVEHSPITNSWQQVDQVPSTSSESKQMSKGLKQHGFRFVGPTTCYAFMQAVGMVNDHVEGCFRYRELAT